MVSPASNCANQELRRLAKIFYSLRATHLLWSIWCGRRSDKSGILSAINEGLVAIRIGNKCLGTDPRSLCETDALDRRLVSLSIHLFFICALSLRSGFGDTLWFLSVCSSAPTANPLLPGRKIGEPCRMKSTRPFIVITFSLRRAIKRKMTNIDAHNNNTVGSFRNAYSSKKLPRGTNGNVFIESKIYCVVSWLLLRVLLFYFSLCIIKWTAILEFIDRRQCFYWVIFLMNKYKEDKANLLRIYEWFSRKALRSEDHKKHKKIYVNNWIALGQSTNKHLKLNNSSIFVWYEMRLFLQL